MRAGRAATIPLWPLLFTAIGVVLLLDNFLLLGDFNAYTLLPLVLVIAGAQVLLRGDLMTGTEARRFGITRGSIETATLEISSAEIDVDVQALQEDWRLRDGQNALIAGQFAPNTRPQLDIDENYAHLQMRRQTTPWFTLADWKVGLAYDLPWQILISTSLGQVNLDLSRIILHDAVIATGFGDIRVVSPVEAFEPLFIKSTLGNVQIVTPEGYNTRIHITGGRMFSVHADEVRYDCSTPGVYAAREQSDNMPQVEIHVHGTFGDAYLI